eukprot:2313183-Pyramimonas_sp.AAC.1
MSLVGHRFSSIRIEQGLLHLSPTEAVYALTSNLGDARWGYSRSREGVPARQHVWDLHPNLLELPELPLVE